MAGLYDLIPGLREVEDDYRREQADAFSLIEPKIGQLIPVLPFTPQMFIHLDGIESPFFAKGREEITEVDIALFLWRVSPIYRPEDRDLRTFFIGNLCLLEAQQTTNEICAYIQRAWLGMPAWPGGAGGQPTLAQWPSRLVDMFGKEYGWTEEYVLNMPYRRLWQYANRILERANPKYREQCAAALRLRGDWLARRNADGAAAGAPQGRN